MSKSWAAIVGLLILLVGGAGLSSTARAQSPGFVRVQNGATFLYGGLQFTVSGCALTLNSTLQSSCASYTDVTTNGETANTVVFAGAEIGGQSKGPGGTNPVIAIETLNNSTGANGGNLFNRLKKNGKTYELTFTLSAVISGSSSNITSVTESLFASVGPSGQNGDITLTDSAFSNGAAAMTVNQGAPTATDTFSAVTTLSFNVDLKLNATTGATYSLQSGTEKFGPAPEPSSMGVFLAGVMALGAARFRKSG